MYAYVYTCIHDVCVYLYAFMCIYVCVYVRLFLCVFHLYVKIQVYYGTTWL